MTPTGQPIVHINATLQRDGTLWRLVDLRVECRTSVPLRPRRPAPTDWRDRLAVIRRSLGLKTDAQAVLALRWLMRHPTPEVRLYAALLVLSIGLPLIGTSDGAARS
jgi:hypothetical protein